MGLGFFFLRSRTTAIPTAAVVGNAQSGEVRPGRPMGSRPRPPGR